MKTDTLSNTINYKAIISALKTADFHLTSEDIVGGVYNELDRLVESGAVAIDYNLQIEIDSTYEESNDSYRTNKCSVNVFINEVWNDEEKVSIEIHEQMEIEVVMENIISNIVA